MVVGLNDGGLWTDMPSDKIIPNLYCTYTKMDGTEWSKMLLGQVIETTTTKKKENIPKSICHNGLTFTMNMLSGLKDIVVQPIGLPKPTRVTVDGITSLEGTLARRKWI